MFWKLIETIQCSPKFTVMRTITQTGEYLGKTRTNATQSSLTVIRAVTKHDEEIEHCNAVQSLQ